MAVYSTIQVGDKQPSPFLGFNFYAPTNGNIGANPNSWSFGDSSNYVSPFTSWSQQIVNATYDLGPYARRVGDGKSGRIIISTISPKLGEIGFVEQCWYGFDDTPYNTIDGTAGGVRYQSKTDWWNSSVKITVCLPDLMLEGHPNTAVEVAVSSNSSGGWNPSTEFTNYVSSNSSLVSYGICGVGAVSGIGTTSLIEDAGIIDGGSGNPSGGDGLPGGTGGPSDRMQQGMSGFWSQATGPVVKIADAVQNAASLYMRAFYFPHLDVASGISNFENRQGFSTSNPIIWRPSNSAQKRWLSQLDPFVQGSCNAPFLPDWNDGTSYNNDPAWFLTIYNRAYPDLKLTRIGNEFSMRERYGFTPSPNTDALGDILTPIIGKNASDSIRTFLDFSPLNIAMGVIPRFLNAQELDIIGRLIKNRYGEPENPIGGNFDVFRPTELDIRFSIDNLPDNICELYKLRCGEDICNKGNDETISIC
jgi:hypothetical protein